MLGGVEYRIIKKIAPEWKGRLRILLLYVCSSFYLWNIHSVIDKYINSHMKSIENTLMWKEHKEKGQEEVKHKDRSFGAHTCNADFVLCAFTPRFCKAPGGCGASWVAPRVLPGCALPARSEGARGCCASGGDPTAPSWTPKPVLVAITGILPAGGCALTKPPGTRVPRSPRPLAVPPSGCARCTRKGQNSLPDVLMLIKRKCVNPQTPPCLSHPRLTFKTTGVCKAKAARCSQQTHAQPPDPREAPVPAWALQWCAPCG